MRRNESRQSSVLSPKNGAKLTLERVLGITGVNNCAVSVNPVTQEIAYPAGCVVVLYNVRRNKQTRYFRAGKAIACLAFSPDGKYLAVGERGHSPSVIIWDIETGRMHAELKKHKYGVSCLAFSLTSKMLVTVGFQHDRYLYAWNILSRQKDDTYGQIVGSSKVAQKVHSIDFSHDGNFFVTVGEKHVKFWYLNSEEETVILSLNQRDSQMIESKIAIMTAQKDSTFVNVCCGREQNAQMVFAITTSGVLCAFGSSRMMEKWVSLEAGPGFALSVTEQYIAVACSSGIVRLFNPTTLEYITTLPQPPALGKANESEQDPIDDENLRYPAAWCVRMTGNKVIVVYSDRTLLVFDIQDAQNVGLYRSFMFHSSPIWDIKMAGDTDAFRQEPTPKEIPVNSFVTCAGDNTIRIWNIDLHKSKTTSRTGTRDHDPVKSEWSHPFSKELLRLVYLDPEKDFESKTKTILGGSCSSDKIPNAEISLLKPEGGLRSVAVHPNRRDVACGDTTGNIKVYDAAKKRIKADVSAHDKDVLCLSYSPTHPGVDALLASGGRDRLVHVFQARDDYPLQRTLEDHSATITAVKFSVDGKKMLSCGGDKTLVMSHVDLKNQRISRYKSLPASYGTIYDMDVDATNKYIATVGQDKRLNIWNISSGKHERSYQTDKVNGELYRVDIDPSGIFAATSCQDKWIRLYDFYSGECIAKVTGHSELTTGIKFTPDCRRIVSVSADGCIFVWRLSPEISGAIRDRLQEIQAKKKATSTPSQHDERVKALTEDPPEPPRPKSSDAIASKKRAELHSILDQSLSSEPKPVVLQAWGDKPAVNVPSWARSDSTKEIEDQERPSTASRWEERGGYALFGHYPVKVDDDDEADDDVADEKYDIPHLKSPTAKSRVNLKVVLSPKSSDVANPKNEEEEDTFDDEKAAEKLAKDFEEIVMREAKAFDNEAKHVAVRDSDDSLRQSHSKLYQSQQLETDPRSLEDMKVRVSTDSKLTLQQERQMRRKQQKVSKTQVKITDMTSKLAALGVIKQVGDPVPPTEPEIVRSAVVVTKESVSKNVVETKETIDSSAQKGETRSSTSSLGVDNVNVSLSQFTSGYKGVPNKNESNRASSTSSLGLSDGNVSLSQCLDGYKAAVPDTSQGQVRVSTSSSLGISDTNVSLSQFTSGFAAPEKPPGAANESIPSSTSSSVGVPVDVSLSQFTSGFAVSEKPPNESIPSSTSSSVGIPVDISLSQFTSGFATSAEIPVEAPAERESIKSAASNSIDIPIDVSLSQFTSGFADAPSVTASSAAPLAIRESIKSAASNSIDIPVDVSLSQFTSGFSELNSGNDQSKGGGVRVSQSIDVDGINTSMSAFTSGYTELTHETTPEFTPQLVILPQDDVELSIASPLRPENTTFMNTSTNSLSASSSIESARSAISELNRVVSHAIESYNDLQTIKTEASCASVDEETQLEAMIQQLETTLASASSLLRSSKN